MGIISAHDMQAPRQCWTFADMVIGVNPSRFQARHRERVYEL